VTKSVRRIIPILLVLSIACASTQPATAYKTIGAVVTAVDAAMTAYGNQVRSGGIAVPDQLKVQKAYETYQALILPEIASKGLSGTVTQNVTEIVTTLLAAIQASGIKL
jgi:hypothetical protein